MGSSDKSSQGKLALMTIIYSCVSPAQNTIFVKCNAMTCLGFSFPTILIVKTIFERTCENKPIGCVIRVASRVGNFLPSVFSLS